MEQVHSGICDLGQLHRLGEINEKHTTANHFKTQPHKDRVHDFFYELWDEHFSLFLFTSFLCNYYRE